MENKKKFISYRAPDAAEHLQKVAKYLQQHRGNADQRLCDVEILLEDGAKEYVHSIVMAAQAKKFAKIIEHHTPPISLDLSFLRGKSVLRAIEYMYNGETKMCVEAMMEHLTVTGCLGIDCLHKSLQKQLGEMFHDHSQVANCLNICCENSCLVSTQVRENAITAVVNMFNTLSTQEILSLSSSSAIHLVSANHLKTEDKIRGINLVLLWLRNPPNATYTEQVLSHARFTTLQETDNERFRKDLQSCVINAREGHVISVGREPNGSILIYKDQQNFLKNTGAVVNQSNDCLTASSGSRAASSIVMAGCDSSETVKEMRRLPNVFSSDYKVDCHRTNEETVVDRSRTREKASSSECVRSSSRGKRCRRRSNSKNSSSPQVNPAGSPGTNPTRKSSSCDSILSVSAIEFTPSEIFDINRLPNVFDSRCSLRPVSPRPSRSPSRCVPTTVREELAHLPPDYVVFPDPKFQYRPCTSRSQQIVNAWMFSPSEVEDIQNLPPDEQVFQKSFHSRPSDSVLSLNGRSYTQSEVDYIRGLPNQFNFRKPLPSFSQQTLNRKVRTNSEMAELDEIRTEDVFPTKMCYGIQKTNCPTRPDCNPSVPCAPCPRRAQSPMRPISPMGLNNQVSPYARLYEQDRMRQRADMYNINQQFPLAPCPQAADFVIGQQQQINQYVPTDTVIGKRDICAQERHDLARIVDPFPRPLVNDSILCMQPGAVPAPVSSQYAYGTILPPMAYSSYYCI